MRLARISVRQFRSYERAAAPLGGGLTVVTGDNGAGKTNLLEAMYVVCTGRSFRTASDRELVRFGCSSARVEGEVEDDVGRRLLAVAIAPGELKRITIDGTAVDRLIDSPLRPLVSVFVPDRLELIKGPPSLRRAHLDQFVAALWPARVATRRAYNHTLMQRNALLSRIRAGLAARSSIEAWDEQLAQQGLALSADRAAAVKELRPAFVQSAAGLGLDGSPEIVYRPRAAVADADGFTAALAERLERDLERGFTSYGPHRDELVVSREARELRTYGSQGQQRLGLLGLLLAERAVVAAHRGAAPLLLLDDVMSELDRSRREALVGLIAETAGQAVISTTDLAHVPGVERVGAARISVAGGSLVEQVSVAVMRR